MKNVNFVAIDFETATPNFTACQLGIVVVKAGQIVKEQSYLIQPPDNKYSKHNINIHGITSKDTKNAPTFAELWGDIKEYFEKQVIVHHSDGFDIRVLNRSLEYYNVEPCRFLSTESTMYLFEGVYSRSLKNLCTAYGLNMENHHDALSDARNCAQLFLKYLKGQDPDYSKLPKKKTQSERNMTIERNLDFDHLMNQKIKSETLIQDLTSVNNPDTIFYNKKIVISGVFEKYSQRNDLGIFLKSLGTDINTALSKQTNIFIIGDKCGPAKMKKAQQLQNEGSGLRIIEEEELYQLINEIENKHG